MNKLLLLVGLLFVSLHPYAQLAHRVDSAEVISGTYTDLGSNGTLISTDIRGLPFESTSSDEKWSSAQEIGFPFRLGGKLYTKFYLNTDGYVALDTVARDFYGFYRNTIAAFYARFYRGGGQAYRVYTSGEPGSRVCTIQFKDIRHQGTGGAIYPIYDTVNFQIKLYEGSDYIDFVYGRFVAAQSNYSAMTFEVYVSANNRRTYVTKDTGTAWERAAFTTNGFFQCSKSVLPNAGITYRFKPFYFDVAVQAVYVLGKQPVGAGTLPIQVRLKNHSPHVIANFPLQSQVVSLSPNVDTVITVPGYPSSGIGYRSVSVAANFDDDTLANNRLTAVQEITTNLLSHADTTTPTASFSYPGLTLARYKIKGTAAINRVHINIAAGSTGTPVYAVVLNAAGAIIGQSATRNLTAGDIGAYLYFDIPDAPSITDTSFYVGLAQTGNAAVAVQPEYPARPGAFYQAAINGGALMEVTDAGKFMIQAGIVLNLENDLGVSAILALKKVPLAYAGYAVSAGAIIKNNSSRSVQNLPVRLTIDGLPSYSSTKLTGSLGAGDSVILSFEPYAIAELGDKVLHVSIPDDADSSNNRASFTQLFTPNVYSLSDSVAPYFPAGLGSSSGILMTNYSIPLSDNYVTSLPNAKVKQVRVHISSDPANIGRVIRVVLYVQELPLRYSDPYIIQGADLDQYKIFNINDPYNLPFKDIMGYDVNSFYVGVEQFGDSVAAYNPVSYQSRSTFNSSYYYSTDENGFENFSPFYGAPMIEAIVSPGNPIGESSDVPLVTTLASWNFSAGNSPEAVAATIYSSSLISSNLIRRGPGAGAGAGSSYFQSAGFGNNGIATNNTDYFEVKLSPASSRFLSLDKIVFDPRGDADFAGGTGAESQFAYSLNGVDFTLIDNPARTITGISPATGYVDVSGVQALQSIPYGTTVTLRYYASGQTSNGHWGFGPEGLQVYGIINQYNTVIVDPVKPNGADFVFNDCTTDLPGSVHFRMLGKPVPGNVYKAELLLVSTRTDSDFQLDYDYTHFADIGTLVSDSNAGTIQLTMPNYSNGLYVVAVRGTNTYLSTYSTMFSSNHTVPCTLPFQSVRSVKSGKWTDQNTWESFSGVATNSWIPATHWPAWIPNNVNIRTADTVLVDQPVTYQSVNVFGHLKVVNAPGSPGSITSIPFNYDERSFGSPRTRVEGGGVLQLVSHGAPVDSVATITGGYVSLDVRPHGKLTIGDGSSSNGPGFHKFVQGERNYMLAQYVFRDSAIFEWNTTSGIGLPMNMDYFTYKRSYFFYGFFSGEDLPVAHPILRLTRVAAGFLSDGDDSLWVNGFVEVNTPITLGGTGRKVFRDGIMGTAGIDQSSGAGKILVQSSDLIVPITAETGTRTGLLDGNLTLDMNGEGLVLDSGVTVTKNSSIELKGTALSNGKIAVEPAAQLIITDNSTLQINNGNFNNEGMLNGTGRILFTGANRSTIRSASTLQPALELNNKQLSLASTIHTTGSVKLADNSRLQLGAYNLQMDSAALIADASNFIVTNDTGMLSRMVVSDSLLFPVGADNTTYTPLTLTSAGDAGKSFSVRVKVGVLSGGLTGLTIDSAHVNRSWVVQKSDTSSSNAGIQLQWPAGAEQPGFNRGIAYVSQLANCGALPDCNGVYYDEDTRQQAVGNDPYALSRSNINRFSNNNGPAIFVVQSGPIVFRFTGNGDWNNPANWTHGVVPPLIIPRGMEVIVSPATGGSCIVNGDITVLQGGKLMLTPGSSMEVRH